MTELLPHLPEIKVNTLQGEETKQGEINNLQKNCLLWKTFSSLEMDG